MSCRLSTAGSTNGRRPLRFDWASPWTDFVTHDEGSPNGKDHTNPVFYLPDGERLVICNVNPGFERPNPWTPNLRANPVARVQVGYEVRMYQAREATDDKVGRYWSRLVETWPAYLTHYDRSGQRSIFVLEPL